MFTGIIEELGHIEMLTSIGVKQYALTVRCQDIQADLKIGDSVAIDGVCLTTIRFNERSVIFELSAETYDNTLFVKKEKNAAVNIERALRLGDRLGGHIVQGHVDACRNVLKITKQGEFFEMVFSHDASISRYLAHKGSVAINGISLTVADLTETEFKVAVIPHTFEQTNLANLKAGDFVHLETDCLARYIERLMQYSASLDQPDQSAITMDFLRANNFLV